MLDRNKIYKVRHLECFLSVTACNPALAVAKEVNFSKLSFQKRLKTARPRKRLKSIFQDLCVYNSMYRL